MEQPTRIYEKTTVLSMFKHAFKQYLGDLVES